MHSKLSKRPTNFKAKNALQSTLFVPKRDRTPLFSITNNNQIRQIWHQIRIEQETVEYGTKEEK
jgi:hypothetical protein